MRLDLLPEAALRGDVLTAARALCDSAFGGEFSDEDWAHASGDVRALAWDGDRLVAHASLVPRRLHVGGPSGAVLACGYLEAVAVAPDRQGAGLGTAVVVALADLVQAAERRYAVGALSSGEHGFYERLGWERWRGRAHVVDARGTWVRVPDEDDAVMVLRTSASAALDLSADLAVDDRPGDAW